MYANLKGDFKVVERDRLAQRMARIPSPKWAPLLSSVFSHPGTEERLCHHAAMGWHCQLWNNWRALSCQCAGNSSEGVSG